MTRKEANEILDRVRKGQRIDSRTITRALQATGDIEDETCQVVSAPGEWMRTDHGALAPAGLWDGLMR